MLYWQAKLCYHITTSLNYENVLLLQGAIVSVFSIGALVGALLSGPLSDLAGRKVTMIVGGSLYALGGTLQTFSFFLWSVRFIYSTKDVLVCPICM